MSTTDDSNSADPSVLLQLSSCTTLAQLARALEESSTLDPAIVLAAVPECLDSRGLASLLFDADGIARRRWSQKENEEEKEDGKWARACVARAEAVDRWTGRVDWAVQWLEAVRDQIQIRSQIISETLYRARLLQSVIVAGTTQTQHQQQEAVAATLADLDAMSVDELVGWAMAHTVVGNCPDPAVFSVLDTLLPCQSDDGDWAPMASRVRESWNRWWLRHMVGGSSPGLMGKLIARYPRSFDTYTVLASIYAVGGPCSGIAGAKHALSVILANSSTVSAGNDDNGTIEFPETIRQLVSGRDDAQESDKWYESLGSMTDDQLALVAKYLHRLLSNEQFEQARTLIEETETVRVSDSLVCDAICQAAREMFDNAESGNNTGNGSGVRAAARCLDVLPASMQQQAADGGYVVRKERLLIEAAHLVWTLGSGGMGGLSAVFNKDNNKGNQILPIEIRLSTDPFNLIQDILARTPGGYKKQRSVREIASKLLEISSISSATEQKQKQKQQQQREVLASSDTVSWQRDLGVRNTAEALVSALLLEAATNSGDYGTAYDYVRQLINARPVLVRARGAAETYRSKQLLLHRDDDAHDPSCGPNVEVRAIECIWKGCVELVTEWENDAAKWRSGTDSVQSAVERDRRLEVVSMALGLCPTSEVPRILQFWNRIQAAQLSADDDDVSESTDLQPWPETAASSLPSRADHGDALFASSTVYQTLVGGSKSPITSTTTEEENDGTANAELERAADVSELSSAVCTFDAAIVKRNLQMAGSTADRVVVLMEWLVFALTTKSKSSTHASDIAFRRRLEAYVAAQYPAEAIETLVNRVYPRLDAENYAALEGFYSFYARCLKPTAEDGGGEYEQVCVWLELAKRIPQECPAFVSKVKFADVVSPFTRSNESECHAMLRRNMVMIKGKRVVWPQCVGELVGLAPELARIRPLLRDGIDNGNGADKEWWTGSDGSVVASKLCRWALTDQATSQAFDDNSRSLEHVLADCLPHMVSVDDVSAVAATAAFDTNACARLDPETRHRCVTMCWDHHEADNSDGDNNSDRLLMRQAQVYMEYVAQVHTVRDPFMFAELPGQWACQLDVCNSSSSKDLMRKDNGGGRFLSADAVAQACTNVLLQMCVDRTVASYFVCQSYVFARDLVDQLLRFEETSRVKSPMPELSQLYLDAIRSVIASSNDANDSDTLCRQLTDIAARPLELCALVSADTSALGVTMQAFGAAFGSELVRLAHANEETVKLDSAARLALLDVVAQHGTTLPDGNADDAELAATDGKDAKAKEKESAEFLHFCLLAERHWGVKIEQSAESRTLEGRASAWIRLLQRTRADQQSLVVDVLVALLARWSSSSSDAGSVEVCVAALVGWAVRNHASRVAVQSVVTHGSLFTHSAGERVIGALVADARRTPAMVVPLAILALLAYPGTEWAEQSMELVVYVATRAEAAKSTQAATETETALAHNDGSVEGEEEEEGGSAWGLEDDLDELSDNDNDNGNVNDNIDAGSDSAAIAEYLTAYSAVLRCTALHMAIVASGYVSACAACPDLVDALGHTLLSAAAGHPGSADLGLDLELELADTLVSRTQPQTVSLAPGMRSSHELLRRAIHAAYDAGMHTRAVAWIHALLGTPAVYRLGASLLATRRLIAHVDRVVLGSNDTGGRDSAALVPETVHQDAGAANEHDDNAWGDDDIDLDADLQNL
ncbi:hypothetical protein GGI11_003139 [Coemansia sp. RSA 2049]|nr:hypothetical protein GGI11_003139 [Coemansia sp. RSA 2049]